MKGGLQGQGPPGSDPPVLLVGDKVDFMETPQEDTTAGQTPENCMFPQSLWENVLWPDERKLELSGPAHHLSVPGV